MVKTKDLLDRIDEVRANSVTPEKFKETWGYSLEEHVDDMMDFIHELEAKEAPVEETINYVAEEKQLRPAAEPAAAAAEKEAVLSEVLKSRLLAEAPERETLEKIVKKLQTLLKQMKETREYGEIGKVVTLGSQKTAKKRHEMMGWELKLVAVNTGSGKTLASGAPVFITDIDRPSDERIVARVYSPGKQGRTGFVEKVGLKGLEGATPKDGVRGLMVDVGELNVGDLVCLCPDGSGAAKGSRGRKSRKA